MSLFRLKSLWTEAHPGEEFCDRHLAVGKLGRSPIFAVGSFKGILRLYLASYRTQFNLRKVYEHDFKEPIIDVRFVIHPDQSVGDCLGVLLFKKFIFAILEVDQQSLPSKHTLEKSSKSRPSQMMPDQIAAVRAKLRIVEVDPSFAICTSPLGVTTLNSTLQLLTPPSILKLKTSEPIYAFTSSIDQFVYSDSHQVIMMQGNTEQWRVILGHPIKSLHAYFEYIIAVTEKSVWELRSTRINRSKIFQDEITECVPIAKTNDTYNLLVCTTRKHLLIYTQDYRLLWALRLDSTPLKLVICHHPLLKGLLAILTQDGELILGYSGTEIAQADVKPIQDHHTQLSRLDHEIEEMTRLLESRQEAIAPAQSSKGKAIEVEIVLDNVSIQGFNGYIENQEIYMKDSRGQIQECRMDFSLRTKQNWAEGRMILKTPSNIYCPNSQICVKSITGSSKFSFQLYTICSKFPYSSKVTVIARCQKAGSGPQIVSSQFKIPLLQQCRMVEGKGQKGGEGKEQKGGEGKGHRILIECSDGLPPVDYGQYIVGRAILRTIIGPNKVGESDLRQLCWSINHPAQDIDQAKNRKPRLQWIRIYFQGNSGEDGEKAYYIGGTSRRVFRSDEAAL